jgi:cytochrome c oxidase assembly protein subunit 15
LNPTAIRAFHKLCLSTLIAVYILILVGGVVRSTGSGMGCPDWPRCFGSWVPPTSVDQLPANYKETYSALREKKNQKFAKYLSLIGFPETADKVLNDKSILAEADFNSARTWTEYLNRVAGVIIGFFIIVLFARSWKFRTTAPQLFWLSFATLVGVIFQGWFGSIVVSTNLTTWTITVHMFLALVIVGLLVYLFHISDQEGNFVVIPSGQKTLLWACFLAVLAQVFLGTEVREVIDQIGASLPRNEWILGVGVPFLIHRTFSILVFILNLVLFLKLRQTRGQNILSRVVIILILTSTATGVWMGYFAVPPFLQPVHLLLATITCGTLLLMMFRAHGHKEVVTEQAS